MWTRLRTRRICSRAMCLRKCGRWRTWRSRCLIPTNSYMSIKFNRRTLLSGMGSVALSALLEQDRARAGVLSPKPQQIPAKAKACIFLTMEGGPSHLDTFDPKPKLEKLHMTEFTRKDKFASAMESGTRY